MADCIVWVDIPVADLERASAFYAKVLDIEVKREFPDMPIGVFAHEKGDVAGCIYQSEEDKPSDCGPLLYLNASGRLDEAVAAVEPAGGKVLKPKHAIGPFGSRAIVLDSEGNRIALHSE